MTNTSELILPTSPADIKKLKGMIEEAALCMQRIDDQKDQMKSIFDAIKDQLQIAPKHARKMTKTYHKNNFSETQAEYSEFEALYESVMGIDD
jgi:hypothetical protein